MINMPIINISLQQNNCIPLHRNVIQQLLTTSGKNGKDSPIYAQISIEKSVINNDHSSNLHYTLEKQHQIYLTMRKMKFYLEQLAVQNKSIPEELVVHILSYLSYADIVASKKNFNSWPARLLESFIWYTGLANDTTTYELNNSSIHPVKLLEGYCYLSHNDLFAILSKIIFFKRESESSYYLKNNDAFITLPDNISRYINTFLCLCYSESNNIYGQLKLFDYNHNPCRGKLFFIYLSGIEECTHTTQTDYFLPICCEIKLENFGFNNHCTHNGRVLAQKEIMQKASELVCQEVQCCWCNLYKDYVLDTKHT